MANYLKYLSRTSFALLFFFAIPALLSAQMFSIDEPDTRTERVLGVFTLLGASWEMAEFCEMNFGVSFPLFSKVSVKGEDQHPLFSTLTNLDNPDFTGEISWNFEKFLIDRNGNLLRRFKSNVTPESEDLIDAIVNAL